MSDKRKEAIVVGFDYYGRFLSTLMNERSERWHLTFYGSGKLDALRAMFAARSADAIITFGGPSPNAALVDIARSRKIPVLVIWAGSDVASAQRDPGLLEIIKRYGFTNVSDGPWLVDELAELGIRADYVPVTAIEAPQSLTPFPERFSVLTYLPEPRRSFYGERAVYALAREFPDVPFRVVGRGARNPIAPKNVEFLGYVDDMPQRIDEATVVLRLPEHDGKSMLVLEALARGRHVIWNYDFPGVHHAPRTVDAAEILRTMLASHANGTFELNRAGYDYVAERFSRSVLAGGFERALDRAVEERSRTVRTSRKRVAIGGLNLFTAQIAQELEAHTAWEPVILRLRSRLEVFSSMITLASAHVWYSIGAPLGDRWLYLWWQFVRTPRVIHWVGSDIAMLASNARLRALCRQPHVINLAEADWTIEELRRFGIDAAFAPLPPRLSEPKVSPMPEKFTVLLYIPKTRGDFYGRREYERLMRAFVKRDVKFIVVGGGECYVPPGADVERIGWASSLEKIYERTSVLIRFTKHDGLSLMALEALACGRHLLWSQPFPYAVTIRHYDEMERTIASLLDQHERGILHPIDDAAKYVAEIYNTKRCVDRIVHYLDSALVATDGAPATVQASS